MRRAKYMTREVHGKRISFFFSGENYWPLVCYAMHALYYGCPM